MALKTMLKWIAVIGVGFLASQVSAGEMSVLETQQDKVNYGIGIEVVRNFKAQGIDIDLDMVIRGMKDALAGGKLLMDEKELRKIMSDYQNEVRRKQKLARSMAAENNLKAGEAFLAENRKKEGVVTLPDGLQYQIIREGTGKIPADADMVEINYRGFFINGTEFDSSYDEEKPATLKVGEGGGIPAWSEALKLMPVGSKWRLFIPPQLAFGEKGVGRIGPNETTIFDVELLAVH